jgi:hypothetical protein
MCFVPFQDVILLRKMTLSSKDKYHQNHQHLTHSYPFKNAYEFLLSFFNMISGL